MQRRLSVHLRLLLASGLITSTAVAEQMIRDPHFQNGFRLLAPEPGKRVVYGEVSGSAAAKPVWDLAQWSSRFPLQSSDCWRWPEATVWSNRAKTVVAGRPGSAAADLSLAVHAGVEYPQPRRSAAESWVHLLVQQDFTEPPALGELESLNLHLEARLKTSRLAKTNDYSPSIHAAQFLVYLTIANRNPKAPGYQECFWFGIPVYDNRDRVVPSYAAQDFGDTGLFICTPGSANFTARSTHDLDWVTFEKDLLPLIRNGLDLAVSRGFIKGSRKLSDYRPLGIFIGWEVPGTFDVDLQIRNLSLESGRSPQR